MTTCVGPCRRRPTEPKTDSWRDGNIKFHVKLISLGSANGVLSGVQLHFKLHLFRKFFVFVISLSHSRLLRFGLGELPQQKRIIYFRPDPPHMPTIRRSM